MVDDFNRDTPVRIYSVSGDDHQDDPAWGLSPIWTGSLGQVASWLMLCETLDGLSVVIDDRKTVWARDLLPALAGAF